VIVLGLNAGVQGGQSIVSVADAEFDHLCDAMVTVPDPMWDESWNRRRTVWLVVMAAIPFAVYVVAFVVYLVDLFTHRFVPKGNYLPLASWTIQLPVFVVVFYLLRFSKVRHEGVPSLRIFPTGIALRGQFESWKNVGSCRWDSSSWNMLMVEIRYGQAYWRQYAWVSEGYRTVVEEALRRFGKWDV
jgi:hypothetical protein